MSLCPTVKAAGKDGVCACALLIQALIMWIWDIELNIIVWFDKINLHYNVVPTALLLLQFSIFQTQMINVVGLSPAALTHWPAQLPSNRVSKSFKLHWLRAERVASSKATRSRLLEDTSLRFLEIAVEITIQRENSQSQEVKLSKAGWFVVNFFALLHILVGLLLHH